MGTLVTHGGLGVGRAAIIALEFVTNPTAANDYIGINPEHAGAQYNRSLVALYLGEFERGWVGFEWRWHNARQLNIGAARSFEQPLGLGDSSLAGKRLGARKRPRVGLVWSGNSNNPTDHRRSIALADWLPHLPPGFDYFCLQKDVRDSDCADLDASHLFAFEDDLMDFNGTAALCECMDVVISVDTSLLHSSGALGKRSWLLLSSAPDWRWMRDREDTPWYPSVNLYRQTANGDWGGVFSRIAADLQREIR